MQKIFFEKYLFQKIKIVKKSIKNNISGPQNRCWTWTIGIQDKMDPGQDGTRTRWNQDKMEPGQ